ncbi:MAG: PVC-type heme-binding CxxCH protein [Isosphaeraceae bacterium]
MTRLRTLAALAACLTVPIALALTAGRLVADAESPLKVLLLGDRGHHRPAERAAQLIPVMHDRGIEVTYTENVSDLNPTTLAKYDALAVYANIDRIEPDQEKALLDYVANGGGFVPLHCASFCFRNSDAVVGLMGALFQRHGTGEFDTNVADANHPIMKGLVPFKTWDETYVHTKHNPKDRIVLQTRTEGSGEEPWTWVRTHGKGRVFYTAYGHDGRTWGQPGFHDLVERGIRWAANKGEVFDSHPRSRASLKTLQYEKSAGPIPNYLAGRRWGTQGEIITEMQKPLSPAESVQHMVLPKGFEARLFAAEPDIAKPLCMAWDHKGRLWIAESTDYPNDLKKPGEGDDRIKICEDTDGDGKADRFTVFADKLSIPTSLAFSNGGLIVHGAPDTLFLKDNDGDGKADERRVLFTGWGTRDTHAGPSNLRYGFDNWFWGMVGYSGFAGTVGGERHRFAQGFYRFRPDGSKLEFLRSTNNNTWGLGFSEEGVVFGSTANGCPSVYLPVPNRYYEAVRGWSPSVLQSIASWNRFYPRDRARPAGRLARRVHRGGRPRDLHGAGLSEALLEPHVVRLGADRPPDGDLPAGAERQRLRLGQLVEPRGQRRRVDLADLGRGRARRARLDHRLVQLHRPAQPHAERLPDRQGGRVRHPAPRQDSTGASYRLVYKDAPAAKNPVLDPTDGKGWSPRCPTTTSSAHAPSACWSNGARPTSCPNSSPWSKTPRSTRSA